MPENERHTANWLPALVLVAIVVVMVGGWLAFPLLQHFMQRQDCIATGHINCGG